MVNRNIQMKNRNNGEWENLFPLTLMENVFGSDGKSLVEKVNELNTDIASVENGLKTDIESVENGLNTDIESIENDLNNRLEVQGLVSNNQDDTEELQTIFNNTQSKKIILQAGRTYYLSKGIDVDLSKINGIDGNGSRLVIKEGNDNALKLNGSMTSEMTASPSSIPNSMKINEKDISIENLKIYSEKNNEGTGIIISNAIGVNVNSVSLMNLENGIKLVNRNRNINISNSHIYNITGYGIFANNNSDLHQINIIGNHISYTKTAIKTDNSSIYNIQIVGNDIEASPNPEIVPIDEKRIISMISNSNYIEDVIIVGNTIEAHYNISCLIELKADTRKFINVVTISSNAIGNSNANDIFTENVTGLNITGNSFKRSNGYSIRAEKYLDNTSVNNNTFEENASIFRYGIDETEGIMVNVDISNNIANDMYGKGIEIIGHQLYNVKIENNSLFYANNDTAMNSYIINVEFGNIQGLYISGNMLKMRDWTPRGIQVYPDFEGRIIGLFVTNNLFMTNDSMTDTLMNIPNQLDGLRVIKDNIRAS